MSRGRRPGLGVEQKVFSASRKDVRVVWLLRVKVQTRPVKTSSETHLWIDIVLTDRVDAGDDIWVSLNIEKSMKSAHAHSLDLMSSDILSLSDRK